jgi:hypothetical protein
MQYFYKRSYLREIEYTEKVLNVKTLHVTYYAYQD